MDACPLAYEKLPIPTDLEIVHITLLVDVSSWANLIQVSI
jgi:hypothetical protein